MKVWATRDSILDDVADLPRNWLAEFAARQPNDVRKFADKKSGMLVYRVQAVLEAVESGRYFRVNGEIRP